MRTPDFYELLYRTKVRIEGRVKLFSKKRHIERFDTGLIFDLFDEPLLEIPLSWDLPRVSIPFSSEKKRTIIVAERILFGKRDVNSPSREFDSDGDGVSDGKLYREVFITDEDTSRHLERLPRSPWIQYLREIEGKDEQDIAFTDEFEVITDFLLPTAVRASIADPLLMQPLSIEEKGKAGYFCCGSANLVPMGLAKALADEVIVTTKARFEGLEEKVIKNAYKFSMNDRLGYIYSQDAEYWVDLSDGWMHSKEIYLRPNFDEAAIIAHGKPTFYVPEGPQDKRFQRIIDAQWKYGYSRAREALSLPRNTKSHIRAIKMTADRDYLDGFRGPWISISGNMDLDLQDPNLDFEKVRSSDIILIALERSIDWIDTEVFICPDCEIGEFLATITHLGVIEPLKMVAAGEKILIGIPLRAANAQSSHSVSAELKGAGYLFASLVTDLPADLFRAVKTSGRLLWNLKNPVKVSRTIGRFLGQGLLLPVAFVGGTRAGSLPKGYFRAAEDEMLAEG
jgi:hypothetical protein